jgi:hypothetical protein
MPRNDHPNVASCDNKNNSAAAQHRSKHTPQTWLMQLQEGQNDDKEEKRLPLHPWPLRPQQRRPPRV